MAQPLLPPPLPPLPDIPARIAAPDEGGLPPPVLTPPSELGLPCVLEGAIDSGPFELAFEEPTVVSDIEPLSAMLDAVDQRLTADPLAAATVLKALIHHMAAEGQLSPERLQAMLDAR